MCPQVIKHTAQDFSQVMSFIEVFQGQHPTAWYRGCADTSHNLTPSLLRHPSKKTAEDLHRLELELAASFTQRSRPFVHQTFSDEWEATFFMQHYGIPTRLLDWTESPFVGLYFSLSGSKRDKKNKVIADVALWMLDPAAWNKSALVDISYKGGILDSKKEQVKSYGPSGQLEERKNLPIMIHGTHNSARIVAQRGTFALFGKSMKSMEDSFNEQIFQEGTLQQLIIKKEYVDEVASSLFRKGISDSTVYPDVFGLSLELRRSFGF